MEEKHMEQKWLRELYYISIHEMRNPVRALWVLYQQHSPNSIKDRLWNWYTYILCDTLVVDNPIAIMELQKLMESLIELAWLLCQMRPIEASEETYRTLNTGSDMETPHYWPRHRLEAYDFRQPMVFIEGHFFMFFELTDCRKILGKWLGYALSLSAIPEKEMGDSAFFLDFLLRLVDLLHLIKKREIDDFIQYKEQFT